MNRLISLCLLVAFVALASVPVSAYPYKPHAGLPNMGWGWSDSEGYARPFAVTATGQLEVNMASAPAFTFTASGVLEVAIASDNVGLVSSVASVTAKVEQLRAQQATESDEINAAVASTTLEVSELAAQQATETDEIIAAVASVATTILSTPTVKIDQTTAGSTNGVDPATSSLASTTGNPARPFATMLYLTDGTNFQRWFTSYVLSDGVNGQNSAAVGNWVYDHTDEHWDRMPGNATNGVLVYSASLTADLTSLKTALQSSPTVRLEVLDASGTAHYDPVPGNATGLFTLTAPETYFKATAACATLVSQDVTPALAGRTYVGIQNHSATESLWVCPNEATCSFSSGAARIEVKPGCVWERDLGPGINIPFVASTAVDCTYYQGY